MEHNSPKHTQVEYLGVLSTWLCLVISVANKKQC